MLTAPTTNKYDIQNAKLLDMKEDQKHCVLTIMFNSKENLETFLTKMGSIPPGAIYMRIAIGQNLNLFINIQDSKNVLEEIKPTLDMLSTLAEDFDFSTAVQPVSEPSSSSSVHILNSVSLSDFGAEPASSNLPITLALNASRKRDRDAAPASTPAPEAKRRETGFRLI